MFVYRKNLYVWKIPTGQLVKVLDAHFGRILAIVPYTIGPWNSVIIHSNFPVIVQIVDCSDFRSSLLQSIVASKFGI